MNTKLSEIAEFKNGVNFNKVDNGKLIKCIGVGDFGGISVVDDFNKTNLICIDKEISDDYFLKDNDILFVRSNGNKELVGRSMIVFPHEDKVVCSGFCIRMRITSPDIMPMYLYYLMNSPTYKQQFAKTQQTSINNLNQVVLGDLNIDIPSIKTQQSIVNILSAVTDKIRVNTKIIETLQDQASLLYDYWFTQFDFPDENGKPYKTSGGKMVWNEQLKREIPEEWTAEKLSIVADILSGYSFESTSYVPEGKYKLITIKNVQDNGIDLNVDNFIENVPQNMPEYCHLKQNDILLSLTGNVGRIGLMYSNDCLLNQRVAVIKPKESNNSPYLYFLLKSKMMRQKMEILATGTSQKNLSPIETADLLIPYNKKQLSEFSTFMKETIEAIVLNLKEINELTSLRDWLLPMLMNGQATVE